VIGQPLPVTLPVRTAPGASWFTLLLEDVANLGLDCPLVVGRQRADYRSEFTSGRIRIQRDRIVSEDPTFALQQPFEVDAVLIAETRDSLAALARQLSLRRPKKWPTV
jgi:hypothetical protein